MGKGKQAKGQKKKAKSSSNVFSMFEQPQIQEFKEAFGMIDANRDGFIDKEDLRSTYASLGGKSKGVNPGPQLGIRDMDMKKLEAMMEEANAQSINFTAFLNMLADKLHGTDPEDVIVSAFKLFDPDGKGVISKQKLDEVLTHTGERFSAKELESVYSFTTPDADGMVDYKSLCYVITHGQEEE
ncbi:Oidioi.mRNA.OKI2018_I69.chr1.g1868.t1.cds [Oikopleura dioica]|uniref:Oidioi.mRNA.OKI2018_I69.chr1.g1868.t1.cds n=1 Tax=Oikopleura dioica TaxID=34765 RepID=A0ABN7SUJ2_OIKDI|nr:Oidioi.mRNA.OKI2018_I69.chr1.g1868.t1.cds [Oikopleura dioica]